MKSKTKTVDEKEYNVQLFADSTVVRFTPDSKGNKRSSPNRAFTLSMEAAIKN